jgi:hypothetical protein
LAQKRRKTKPQMNGRLSPGSEGKAYQGGMTRNEKRSEKPSEATMWKIVLVLLATSAIMLAVRIVYDPPVIETRAGAAEAPLQAPLETTYAYAGLRG